MFQIFVFSAALAANPLPVDRAEAAKTCAVAIGVKPDGSDPGVGEMAQALYYLMQAAAARRGEQPLLDTLSAIAKELEQDDAVTPQTAAGIKTQCAARFPLASGTPTAQLPEDKLDRDLMCMGNLSLLQGAVEDTAPAESAKLVALSNAYVTQMMNDGGAEHGLTTQQKITDAMSVQLERSLKIGNPQEIGRMCERALQPS